MNLFHLTHAYHHEWLELTNQAQVRLREVDPDASDPEADLGRVESAEIGLAAHDYLVSAEGYAQSFIMVIDFSLRELRRKGMDVFNLGPIVVYDIRLGRALWELANAVRHEPASDSKFDKAQQQENASGQMLIKLDLGRRHSSLCKNFLIQHGKATYSRFECDVLQIGFDASHQS